MRYWMRNESQCQWHSYTESAINKVVISQSKKDIFRHSQIYLAYFLFSHRTHERVRLKEKVDKYNFFFVLREIEFISVCQLYSEIEIYWCRLGTPKLNHII